MRVLFDWSAEHIWESKNGVFYINEVLKEKKTVETLAQLQRIPHNNSENDEICLKIGRYKILGGKPDVENPRSELTLSGEEFSNLIKFIEKFYSPMEMGVDSFIPVDGTQLSELLKRFKAVAADDSKKAAALLESGILDGDISYVIEHTKRLNSLNEFKTNLDNQALLENYWQKWFETNKWVLGSEFAKILDERRIDVGNIADYLVKSNDGFLDIVEIKKPNGLNVWSTSIDHDNYVPSSDLIKAISQCQNYIFEIERESDSKKFGDSVEGTPVASPRCILVFGRSNNWNEKQKLALRLLNSSLNRIRIITYDQLYQRAANSVGIMES